MYRSAIEERVEVAGTAVRVAVAGIDPDAIPASEATRIYEGLERIVRSATAARTLLARRVDDSMEWKRLGYRSAAEFLAARSGTFLGAAKTEMETSKALQGLPATRDRLLDGTLSPDQGATIAGAAAKNPGAEQQLIDTASRANLQELREAAQKAKAAADPDPEATHARLHRERRVTRFTDGEGARHLRIRGPVDAMSIIEAELDRRLDDLIRHQPGDGPLECRDALVFDAAVEMARRSARADDTDAAGTDGGTGVKKRTQARPEHLALLRLDIEALWRGHMEGDELCEVTGLGPIPVAVARRLLGDAVLKLIITRGDAVAHVTSLTRGPTQAMRYALLWTSPTCTVEGCTRTIIEHDHAWGAEYKDTRHTRLDQLDRLCHTHHDLHTRHSWALIRGSGKRPMVAPDDPRHPGSTAGGPPGKAAAPPGDPPGTDQPFRSRPPDDPPSASRRPPTSTGPPADAPGQADLFGHPAA